jgi:hypothetical protein
VTEYGAETRPEGGRRSRRGLGHLHLSFSG